MIFAVKANSNWQLRRARTGFYDCRNRHRRDDSYINAGIRLDEFYDYGSVEAGELLYGSMNRQLLLHLLNSTDLLKNLANADFERTVGLADKFGRPEIRLVGRLLIVQVLLDREAAEKEKTAREKVETEDEYH